MLGLPLEGPANRLQMVLCDTQIRDAHAKVAGTFRIAAGLSEKMQTRASKLIPCARKVEAFRARDLRQAKYPAIKVLRAVQIGDDDRDVLDERCADSVAHGEECTADSFFDQRM